MAIRNVLIPQEFYDSLTNPDRFKDPIEKRIDATDDKMSKILSDKKKSASEKYIAYDQQIKQRRSLMKQREERELDPLESLLTKLVEGVQMMSTKTPSSRPAATQASRQSRVTEEEQPQETTSRKILRARRPVKRRAPDPPEYAPVRRPPPAPPFPPNLLKRKDPLAKAEERKSNVVQHGSGPDKRSRSDKEILNRRLSAKDTISKFEAIRQASDYRRITRLHKIRR